jgi:1-acyl-sn-glycerol-3-phosphate acyltransferase
VAPVLMRALSYAWRLLATGLGFASLGIGGIVLAATVFPLLRWTTRDEAVRARRVQAVVRASFRAYVAFLQILGLIRLEVSGEERIAACRGVLVVANHPTLLDVVLLMSRVPNAQCVVKHQLWNNRFLGPVVRAAGYIRNDLAPDVFIERCREALGRGGNLIIFPEGTRTVPGRPLRLQRGFANVALLVPADLQIACIYCAPLMLTKGLPWYEIPERPGAFRVVFEDRVETAPFLRDASRAIAARRLAAHLETRFASRHA